MNTLSVGGYTDGVKAHVADPAYRSWIAEALPAWAVAPPLVWLVHEDCAASGEFFSAFGRACASSWRRRRAHVGVGRRPHARGDS